MLPTFFSSLSRVKDSKVFHTHFSLSVVLLWSSSYLGTPGAETLCAAMTFLGDRVSQQIHQSSGSFNVSVPFSEMGQSMSQMHGLHVDVSIGTELHNSAF